MSVIIIIIIRCYIHTLLQLLHLYGYLPMGNQTFRTAKIPERIILYFLDIKTKEICTTVSSNRTRYNQIIYVRRLILYCKVGEVIS